MNAGTISEFDINPVALDKLLGAIEKELHKKKEPGQGFREERKAIYAKTNKFPEAFYHKEETQTPEEVHP